MHISMRKMYYNPLCLSPVGLLQCNTVDFVANKQQKLVSHCSGGKKSKIKAPVDLMRTSFLVYRWPSPYCRSPGGREGARWCSSFIRALISLRMGTAAMKLKDAHSLEGNL